MVLEQTKPLLIHAIILSKLKLLIRNKKISIDAITRHYKNMLSIVVNIDKIELAKTALLIEKYSRSVPSIKEYYDLEEASYIELHYVLRKALLDEVGIMRIQGASALLSRLLFLLAVTNPVIHYRIDLTKYLSYLNTVLSMPVPPRASEAKVVDLLKPGDRIGVVVGSIYSLWILEVFLREALDEGFKISLYICSEEYELNANRRNYTRYLRGLLEEVDIAVVNCVECLEREALQNELLVVTNNLAVLSIIDCLSTDKSLDNTLLLFNPINTPLQEVFGSTPIAMSVEGIRNSLSA